MSTGSVVERRRTLSRLLQLSPSPSDPTLRSRQGAATWDQPAEDRTQCRIYAVQMENMHGYCFPRAKVLHAINSMWREMEASFNKFI